MKRNTRLGVIAICFAALLALALAGCSSGTTGTGTNSGDGTTGGTSSETPTGGTTIVEQNLEFFPSELTVKVGDVVTFSNIDSTTHDVSIEGQPLGNQAPGESVTWTAKSAGTFPFKCTIHPSMTGQVIVK